MDATFQMPVNKIKPIRSKNYLTYIRSKPCFECGTTQDIQAHHDNFGYGSMGSKASDLFTIPLCPECHAISHHRKESLSDRLFIASRVLDNINEFFALGNKL